MSAALELPQQRELPGHGTLAAWHKQLCSCGWCQSASLERTCGCTACTALRANMFFRLPKVAWLP